MYCKYNAKINTNKVFVMNFIAYRSHCLEYERRVWHFYVRILGISGGRGIVTHSRYKSKLLQLRVYDSLVDESPKPP